MDSIPHAVQLPLFAFDKRCTKCGTLKPLDDFYRHPQTKDRHVGICKECAKARARAWHRDNKERKAARARAYRAAHREVRCDPAGTRCAQCGGVKRPEDFLRQSGTRDGLRWICKVCDRQRALAYYYQHRAQQQEAARAWKERNAARIHAYNVEHAARRAADARASYRRHRKRKLAYQKAYATAHRESINARRRLAYETSPDNPRAASARRRALLAGAIGSHTMEEFKALCVAWEQRCACCGATDRPLTEDHIIPLSRGGSDDIGNIAPLCRPCNGRKHARLIDYETLRREISDHAEVRK